MQLKSKALIFGAILTLIALTAIQGYLIYNTYELKKKTFTVDARNAIAKVYSAPEVDSIMWLYRNDFLTQLEAYKNNKLSKEQVLFQLRKKAEAVNLLFIDRYEEGMAASGFDADVKFRKTASYIAISDSLGNKEVLLGANRQDSILLLGTDFVEEGGILINNSTWTIDHDYERSGMQDTFFLEFKSHIHMNILNWELAIVKELSGLLIISVLLFVFVVGLLYYSIHNLLKQKRIAEIKTDFINNITHELKTPLSTLSLATKTLTSGHAEGDAEMTNEAIAIINRQNIRLQRLIDQVLQSSLGYKQIQLSKEAFNASLFIDQVVEDFKLSLQNGVAIEKEIDTTGVLMNADTFYLSTAIINLLTNAIKYGGTRVVVTYSIDRAKNSHRITVTDNGIGISEKYQKFIFDKFYRVSEKDTHNYKGLGLGLYYTHQIIKAHHGSIYVTSKERKGSTFIILIPIVS